ncbi:MAG: molybdopterin-guanine dinucleotide biosynthesis protein B [Methanotrichaceae archaeon]
MKTIAIVGSKKSGKTTLVIALVRSLKRYGKVGTIKHVSGHPVDDKGDTRRHFEAGADVVVGVGLNQFKVTRESSLESALDELRFNGVDFAIVEGFKNSDLPKIVLDGIEVSNCLRKVKPFQIDDKLVEELVQIVISLPDYQQRP